MENQTNESQAVSNNGRKKSLTILIKDKNYEELRQRLATDVQRHEINGAMFWACNCGYPEAVDILIKSGANVNATDQFGATVLHHAVQGQHEDIIISLLRAGARFSEWNMEGETLLHWACRFGRISVVSCLIELNACLTAVDSSGRHPLHLACQHGRYEVIPIILSSRPSNSIISRTIFEEDANDVSNDNANISRPSVRSIHRNGIHNTTQVNLVDDNGWTPLHYACTSYVPGTSKVVKELVKQDANPLLQTPNGKTALDLAFESGRDHLFLSFIPVNQFLTLLINIDSIQHSSIPLELTEAPRPSIGGEEEDEDRSRCSNRQSLNRVRRHYSFLLDDFHKISVKRSQKDRPRSRYVELNDSIVKLKEWSVTSIWRHILQNDDTDLLGLLYDFRVQESEITEDKPAFIIFEDSYILSNNILSEVHASCFENGLSIFSYIRGRYREELESMDYDAILRDMTDLKQRPIDIDVIDECTVMWPLSSSILFISVLCGRFKIVEMLLRLRQFDILPTTLTIILILRNLESNSAFTAQAKSSLKEFACHLEGVAVDVLNKIFLLDNSEGKLSSINYINSPLACLGGYTVIDIAAQASCTEFLSLPCSQVVLYNLWYGKLHWLPYSWKVISKLFPFVLPIYVTNQRYRVRRSNIYSRRISSFESADRQSCSAHILGRECSNKNHALPGSLQELSQSATSHKMRMIGWAFTSPSNKFFYHALAHMIFLSIFSYVLLYDLHFYSTGLEIICHIFVFGYVIEEGQQFIISMIERKLNAYFSDTWNKLDLAAIFICIIGFVMRVQTFNDTGNHDILDYKLYAARVILLTGLLIFYVRILFILSLFPTLGPKLRMMFAMIWNDLLPMLSIFLLFLVSFGIIFQGILYPNGYDLSSPLPDGNFTRLSSTVIISNIVKKSFYGMVSPEYNIETLDTTNIGNCTPADSCDTLIMAGRNLLLFGFKILYVLIVNIMLVNLLIALYSHTVASINEQSTAHWLADNYSLVHEFQKRSICPPPLNVISILIRLIILCFKKKSQKYNTKQQGCSCKVLRYLMIQSFALKGQRYKVGQSRLQEIQVISDRLSSLEKSMTTMTNSMNALLKESRELKGGYGFKQRVKVHD